MHSYSHCYTRYLKLHREKRTRERGPSDAYVLVRVHTNLAVFINKIINRTTLSVRREFNFSSL